MNYNVIIRYGTETETERERERERDINKERAKKREFERFNSEQHYFSVCCKVDVVNCFS